ncbi:hypothetical protein EPUL_002381, partial [Erysiphe pulchra]
MEQTNPFVDSKPGVSNILKAHTDRRRYNLPTASEVAIVIPDDVDRNTRDVILFARNSDRTLSERFEFIPRNHPAYLPLHYVLFYPHGNPGCHWSIPLQNQRVQGDAEELQDATILSDLYSGVIDALRSDSGTQIGEPVILASSYIGGDRHMTKCFQNAIAVTRAIGNLSLFLTFTANPSWPQILENLEHYHTSDTRPDLIAKEGNVCGTTIGSKLSTKYQKRGLPHGHLLLFLHPDCVPRTPEQVDQLVRAQISTDDPALAAIVKSQLTHGPCGPEFPNAPCMRDGKCSKGYPKRWCEATVMRENSYPEYAKLDNDVRWGTERFKFDNLQAIWRLVGYTTLEEKPAVMQLFYHLEGRSRVAFFRVMTREQIATAVESQSSVFTDWMRYNAANTDGRDLFYIDFSMHYTYVKNRGWHIRKKGHTIGRLPVTVPRQGEHLYLRILLITPSAACRALGLIFDNSEWISLFNKIKDSTSAASLRKQFGVIFANSEVLDSQSIWDRFREAFSDDCLFRISSLGRDLDAPPLEWSEEEKRTQEMHLVETEQTIIPIDIRQQIDKSNSGPNNVHDYQLDIENNTTLDEDNTPNNINFDDDEIDELAQDYSRNFISAANQSHKLEKSFSTRTTSRDAVHNNDDPTTEALDFDQEMERQIFSNSITLFLSGRRDAYDTIMHTMNNGLKPKILIFQFCSEGKIVLCVASSGIAVLLLPNGRTAHSLFKIPKACTEDSVCRIPALSQLANLLRRTALIIWNEVTMQSKHNFRAVDMVLRDLCDGNEFFGGIPVLLGGDFDQILPVVLRGRREQVVMFALDLGQGGLRTSRFIRTPRRAMV